jgi:hypothetical protein
MSSITEMRAVVILALALAGCSFARGGSGGKGSLIFSHSQHLPQAECSECHGEVAKSKQGTGGRFKPEGHPGCAKCHEEEVKKKCEMCHRGARDGVRFERVDRKLRFSHAAHGARVKDCASCHPKDRAGGAAIPGHGTCATAACHRASHKAMTCQQCHQDLSRYAVRPVLAGLTHGPSFERRHGTQAKQAVKACTQCHDQTFCAECHGQTQAATAAILFPEKVDRGFIHRGDFVGRHMVEARAQPQTCAKCHGQRHCRSCHALNGLAAAPGTNVRGGISRAYHPAGWTTPGSPDNHGRKARQDIRRCASCHDRGAQSNCVGCHRVGGSGGSPHPPGWSWRNKTALCRQTASCAACHPNGQGCK